MSELMDGGNNINNGNSTTSILSPFQKKKFSADNQTTMLEKLFPVGSKGKEVSKVKMVAQQVKTIEFDNEIPEAPQSP